VAGKPKGTKSGPMLRVTWVKSTIGHKAGARGTIRALGLHRLNQSVQVADNPVTRGMLRRVAFLVKVDEPSTARPAEGEAR
jgi:large subunit ribosomal protein L30